MTKRLWNPKDFGADKPVTFDGFRFWVIEDDNDYPVTIGAKTEKLHIPLRSPRGDLS